MSEKAEQNQAETDSDSITVAQEPIITSDNRMTLSSAALFLGIKPLTLYNWMHHGKAPKNFRLGKQVFFYYDDVISWIRDQYKEQNTC